MLDVSFLLPERIHLLWLAIALVVVLAYLELRGRELLERFVSQQMQQRLARRRSTTRRVVRLILIAASVLFAALAMMRPQTTRMQTSLSKQVSADVIFVLDVSKSMLATDATPTRLERAKADLRDLLPALDESRLGLIAFAGRAAILCPLTPDQSFFRLVLDSVNINSVSRGGTRIGDALHKAIDAFGENTGPRLIVLVTDGEDHDSYALDAANAARQAGVPIVAIGFGSEEGSEIMVEDPQTGARSKLLDRDGSVVRSRLNGELLRELALATKGVYVPASTSVLDLESIVEEHIAPLVEGTEKATVRELRTELYPWFVLASMLFLFGAAIAESPLFAPKRRPAGAAEQATQGASR